MSKPAEIVNPDGTLSDGVHVAVPMSDYHGWSAWGSSDLKAMRLGPPSMVPWRRENPTPDSDATRLGTAVHAAFLEPERFAAAYDHKPDGMSFARKDGMAWRDDPARAGRIILSHDTWTQVEGIVAALHAKSRVAEAFGSRDGCEESVLWTCPDTGERCKGRPDFRGEWVYDLKVTRHAEERSAAFRAYVEGWLHQVSHYVYGVRSLGVACLGGRLILVHPKAPYPIWCLEAKAAALDVVALENTSTLKRLKECRESGRWPGTPDAWTRIDLPPSALAQIVSFTDAEEV